MRLSYFTQTQLALGSDVTLSFASDMDDVEAERLFARLWRYIYDFEKQFSRFLPQSEVSSFNRSAGIRTQITPAFRELLAASMRMSELTDGKYNPFVLPALQQAGYIRSAVPGYEHDEADDHSARSVVMADRLELGDTWAAIPYNTAIDMGGCGKGYLADQLRKIADTIDLVGYRFSLGGDIATRGFDDEGRLWLIHVQAANELSGQLDWVVECPKSEYAVATSGTFRRKGQTPQGDWHHIIDPVTLKPALTDVCLATVGATTALEADVLASCAVITGSNDAVAYVRQRGAKAVLLQYEQKITMMVKKAGSVFVRLSAVQEVLDHA
jgi:thiamine biosynthesis lipoprotein